MVFVGYGVNENIVPMKRDVFSTIEDTEEKIEKLSVVSALSVMEHVIPVWIFSYIESAPGGRT